MLVKSVTHKQDHWDEFLDTCVFTYNTSVHESTRFSPFEIMFGRKATLPIDLNTAKQDGKEKLQKHLETGGELSASVVEKLAMKCLEGGCFTMFPVKQTKRQTAVKATKHVPIYCSCHMPNVPDIQMIECTSCKDWFHVFCASPIVTLF